jgi:glycosyltransferase involved in cell wall biosynthesis
MNVVILSDHQWKGGAATAASQIAASINRCSRLRDEHALKAHPEIENFCDDPRWPTLCNLIRVSYFEDGEDPHACLYSSTHVLWHEEAPATRQLMRLPRKVLPAVFPRPNSPAYAADRLREALKPLYPDLISVHNLHAAAPWGWGPHLIETCLEFAPVVWTLHDMWSFTGRCAYSYDCEKFISGCDAACPTPTEMPALAPEQIRGAWEDRWVFYARHRDDLVLVTPSQWLASQARRGMFAQHRVEVIPYGVPAPRPQRRDDARRVLNIDAHGRVLLIAGFDLTERRKGAEILRQLWSHVVSRPLTVVTMGQGAIACDDPNIHVHPCGWVSDETMKALVYSAADALLHPAPVDNFPNVVLEAFACGTPTIAMPVGGLPELVRPGVSGWLAESATPAALGRAVDRAIGDLSLGENMRESCRQLA